MTDDNIFLKQINRIFPNNLSTTKESNMILDHIQMTTLHCSANCSNRSSSVTAMTISACNSLCQRQRGEPRGLWDDGGEREQREQRLKKDDIVQKTPILNSVISRGDYLSHARQVGTHIWRRVLSAIIYDFLQDLKALRRVL